MKVAALYVETGGIYFQDPDYDAWDEQRDARAYAGDLPVVAHPPCSRWAYTLAPLNERRYGLKVGDDGGCFESALNAVLRCGGVLEHPAHTLAWQRFGIPKPVKGRWLQVDGGPIWTCQVSQCAYGHRAQKRTWLLYKGNRPPFELKWTEPPHTHRVSEQTKTDLRKPGTKPVMKQAEALATPPAFAEELKRLALWSRG